MPGDSIEDIMFQFGKPADDDPYGMSESVRGLEAMGEDALFRAGEAVIYSLADRYVSGNVLAEEAYGGGLAVVLQEAVRIVSTCPRDNQGHFSTKEGQEAVRNWMCHFLQHSHHRAKKPMAAGRGRLPAGR